MPPVSYCIYGGVCVYCYPNKELVPPFFLGHKWYDLQIIEIKSLRQMDDHTTIVLKESLTCEYPLVKQQRFALCTRR